MGTRASIVIVQDEQPIVSIYSQFDGYPRGLGEDIANFLRGKKLVNGYRDRSDPVWNGMGDLAAQLVWTLKKGDLDSIYLQVPHPIPGNHGEEFDYRLSEKDGQVHIRVTGGRMSWFGSPNDPSSFELLFEGPAPEFIAWVDGIVEEFNNR